MSLDKFGRTSLVTRDRQRASQNHLQYQFSYTTDGNFDLKGRKFSNAIDPVNSQDYTTKNYVDKLTDKKYLLLKKENQEYIDSKYFEIEQKINSTTEDLRNNIKDSTTKTIGDINKGVEVFEFGLQNIEKKLRKEFTKIVQEELDRKLTAQKKAIEIATNNLEKIK